ncbi:membrane protein of unknown function [Candidatus Filomicrobium marinum]|uniref:Uncharacterized protein n=2 Tax=Filomicrobium TaxID=119044 RepID=A0A0D6JEL4_9HYPH|nr:MULTISPECIES: hypothetical protein [Filomicrobium]MCV0370345.1 hypothetical protein [Filomicrobium sp.]CFX21656.1 membrane protein of unknown function [Candidatus Filomicrobium marinum]CPR18811.1 membrane protein of unknown function [Candidatus Filomicrobium marinum]SDO13992.1 hypothetical protein SAMN04488061_0383 [Filomicrobium insigne]
MLKRIHYLAGVSVGRACGFGFLGLATTVVGLSDQMDLALSAGGFLSLIACLTLALKALYADKRPYKNTELWLMLEPNERPHAAIAQQIISAARRQAFYCFAHYAAWLAAGMLVASLLWRILTLR